MDGPTLIIVKLHFQAFKYIVMFPFDFKIIDKKNKFVTKML